MRHRRLRRKLGIKTQHRWALLRNLVRELVRHRRIRTTHARAKEASAFVDRMITLAKRGGLHSRRLLSARLACDDTAKALIRDIAPHFKDRQGGYTRVLRLGQPRPGDQADMALLEFSAVIEALQKPAKKEKKAKKAEKTEISHPIKETAKPKDKQEKNKKKDAEAQEKGPEKEQKPESEKKGGFLGSLRKFLKGSD